MTWEEIRNMKEDSLRESTNNPKPKSFVIKGKSYSSYTEYANSEEYAETIKAIEECREANIEASKEFFNSLSHDDQLKCFCHVFSCLYKNVYEDKGSYRHLLYEIFKFGPEAYALGIDCGLMTIHNDIKTHDENIENLNKIFDYLKHIPTKQDFLACYGILSYGQYNPKLVEEMFSGQMKFHFNEDD